MSEESSLPNTEDIGVAKLAIAYEIAKSALKSGHMPDRQSPEQYAERFTKIFMDTWKALIERKESSIK